MKNRPGSNAKKMTALAGIFLAAIGVMVITKGAPLRGFEVEAAPNLLLLDLVPFASGFDQPVAVVSSGDDRLFVVERDGVIRVVQQNGTVLPTPFLEIQARVDSSSSEEGLLGLAFHGDYANNGFFYVNYTNTTGGIRRTRVSRFGMTGDPNIADSSSEEILLTIVQPDWNHNAGDLHFGPDGYLYIPMGDGGGAGDTADNAQNMGLLLGKIIRIDVNSGTGSSPDCLGLGTGSYTIPDSNPFLDGSGGSCDEIWAVGLRNPWRVSFDRLTGDLFIADVGQGSWEEIDFQPAGSPGGENYGWRCYEGNHPYNTAGCGAITQYTFPIFEYPHSMGGEAVVGGFVYRGSLFPNMYGRYFFTDNALGTIWDTIPDGLGGWDTTPHTNLPSGEFTTFGEDSSGEIYLASYSDGTVYHLVDGSPAPTPSLQPTATPATTTPPAPTPSQTPATTPSSTPEAYLYLPYTIK